ncbi:MAG: hypothetical protein M3336_07795, partial [Chloroflexota bacterium]|nr:hypothetical protein [Chloroflexota bacterium]
TYFVDALSAPLSIEGCLVLGNLAATALWWRWRGPFVAATYYLTVALAHVRTTGAYYVISYFSLALLAAWALSALRSAAVWHRLASGAALALVGVLVVRVAATYDLSRAPARVVPELALVRELTRPGERIFVAPYDPYVYLAAERAPASSLPFYFPWQAADPRSEGKLLTDLRANRPPLVIFRADELVNDQWAPREYGPHLIAFLRDEYAPLDETLPVLRDVFVRRDRVHGATPLPNLPGTEGDEEGAE